MINRQSLLKEHKVSFGENPTTSIDWRRHWTHHRRYKTMSSRIIYQDIAGVRDVDVVREAHNFLVSDAMLDHS